MIHKKINASRSVRMRIMEKGKISPFGRDTWETRRMLHLTKPEENNNLSDSIHE